MNKTILALLSILCICILAGELLAYEHPGAGYGSDVTISTEGFEYSFSSNSSSEFNVLLMDNGTHSPIEVLYIHYDEAYGNLLAKMQWYIETLVDRLEERGFVNYKLVDTGELTKVVSGEGVGTAVLMASGAIPEELAYGQLLDWIKSGGTLYWTFHVIGLKVSRSDGTVYSMDNSWESKYLGSVCTNTDSGIYSEGVSEDPFSKTLDLNNYLIYGALDTSKLAVPYKAVGHYYGSLSEITLVKCGSGAIGIISGWTNNLCISDTVQIICSGMTYDSVFVDGVVRKVSGKGIDGTVDFPVVPGNNYLAYVYVSGINPPYGESFALKT